MTRELIERARKALSITLPMAEDEQGPLSPGRQLHPNFIEARETLADLDAHLSAPTSQPTLPIEIHGKLYDVPIPVQVHIVSLGVQIKQADERGDEALRRAHELERLAETSQPDRKALADAKKLLRDFFQDDVGYYRSRELMAEVAKCIDAALAAHPVQEPATCPSCKGSGTQVFYNNDPDWPSEEGQCERCGGTGELASPATPAAPAVPPLILLSTGEYSDYNWSGPYRPLKAFKFSDAKEAYEAQGKPAHPTGDGFCDWLVSAGYLEVIDSHEVHVGSYGRLQLSEESLALQVAAPSAQPTPAAQEGE